jgi:glycosyltransferase involved in cell wall biosynthesis
MINNRFVFIVPCYNAEKTIARMLGSLTLQTYENWICLIRDDKSTDGTISEIQRFCNKENISFCLFDKNGYKQSNSKSDHKVVIWENDEKFWEVKNVLEMIKSDFVKDDDIICRLDGDDFLCDLCALQDINVVYNKEQVDCLWTAQRWADTWRNISQMLPQDADVYKHPWVTSHLKTFRKNLINGINDENFRGSDREYIRRAGDQAIYLPVLHKSKKRTYLQAVMYYYSIDMSPQTFQSEDSKFQLDEANFLRNRGFVK